MKEIKLTQNKVALVDDEDYEYLNQWKWHVKKVKGSWYYAARSQHNGSIVINVMIHRVIMLTPKGDVVDHLDGNGLNCQKYNMRNCSQKQNCRNKRPQKNKNTLYKGVSFVNRFSFGENHKYIRAEIIVNKKYIHLGYFKTQEEAAIAYDTAAKEYFGEFANSNFK